MSWTIPLALYGWIPLVLIAFMAFAPSRAVLLSFLAGWMFLPVPGIELLRFDYSKSTAVPLIVFLAVAVFDGARLARIRWSLADLPIAVLCAVPLATSLSNDLGWYDAIVGVIYQTVTWGLPYLIGRMYFSTPEGLRELAVGLFAAGMIYAPLCLWEIRMSPQLHAWVYGVHQHEWVQTLRGGGFRPMVFMQHGLMVGLWMCAASIVGLALWMSGALRQLWGIPLWLAVPALIVTTVLCKSFGAIGLLFAGATVLLVMRYGRTSLPMVALILVPMVYVGVRTTGEWAGAEVVHLVKSVSAERANSLEYRIDAEEKLRRVAAERPLFGWGGWGRSSARSSDDPLSHEKVLTDSLWIIFLGKHGIVGMASVLLSLFVPVLVLWRRCPPQLWFQPSAACAWALALVLTLYAIDSLVNAMPNPIYLLIAGGLCGVEPAPTAVLAPARARAVHETVPVFAVELAR